MNPLLAFSGWISGWLPSASGVAPRVDAIIRHLMLASVAMVLLLTVLTVFILVRYRRGSRANRTPLAIATWKVEAAWITGTLVIFLFFFFEGAGAYAEMERIPPGLPEINVTGRQWMWDVRYADGRREFNEIHVLLNAPVRIVLGSEDVIHSFFVPAFRIKQDLVPGKVVSTWFNPTRVGSYALFCAQYCGTSHAQMIGRVVVMDAADYGAWKLRGGGASGAVASSAKRGRLAYARFGCASCHDGSLGRKAPRLEGLYGTEVALADGSRMTADELYLENAILSAPDYRVAGYTLVMPSYAGIISPAEASDLAAYLASLEAAAPPLASTP